MSKEPDCSSEGFQRGFRNQLNPFRSALEETKKPKAAAQLEPRELVFWDQIQKCQWSASRWGKTCGRLRIWREGVLPPFQVHDLYKLGRHGILPRCLGSEPKDGQPRLFKKPTAARVALNDLPKTLTDIRKRCSDKIGPNRLANLS
ncbi:Hypothetical protein NTJ_10830 [Nesidiocoris tenuis]|uniref:Uncharacterized protein n=1 Tax=Nesidiocoris tenuis TaxID=355587 RepID=A0ABN7B0S1_9HEMI|nr:Hypothetical protein NTJ_10830 [Nesidiocoris tenuis]